MDAQACAIRTASLRGAHASLKGLRAHVWSLRAHLGDTSASFGGLQVYARGSRMTQDDLRLIRHWAADCAEQVLALFESKVPPTPVGSHDVQSLSAAWIACASSAGLTGLIMQAESAAMPTLRKSRSGLM